jgi:hypothetical protein
MSDPCCWACRSPTGVCLSRHACEHHIIAQAQDDANHRASRQYRDPTGDQAVANAMREKRGRR